MSHLYISLLLSVSTSFLLSHQFTIQYAQQIYNIQTFTGPKPYHDDSDTDLVPPSLLFGRDKRYNIETTTSASEEKWYIIKSNPSDLVMDASDPQQITIQNYTGRSEQLWKFESSGRPGEYYIVNRKTKNVLDVNGDSRKVITRERNGLPSQKWNLNSDNRIINADMKYNLELVDKKYVPGTAVEVNEYDGNRAQAFTLHEQEL